MRRITGSGRLMSLDSSSVWTKDLKTTEAGRRRQRRMHQCEHCDKQFDRPSLLKRHTLTHTGERPFECRFCSKGFSTRSGVNTHERTHTGQRPYVCRICGRRFAAGSNLIFHKYTHSNTRRHQCSQCPKAFVTPGDLRKHEYTHNGQWPFRCSICDRGFATERNLKSHEVTHTEPSSDDGESRIQQTKQRTIETPASSLAESSPQPRNTFARSAGLGPRQDRIYSGSPKQTFTHSPRTYSDPSLAQTSPEPPSPGYHRPLMNQYRPLSGRVLNEPNHCSAFSAPTRKPRPLEPLPVANSSESAEFVWFYERYKAYYHYYISNMANQTQTQPTCIGLPGTTVSTMISSQSIAPISPPVSWSPAYNLTVSPTSTGLLYANQPAMLSSPLSAQAPLQGPSIGGFVTAHPGGFQPPIDREFSQCLHWNPLPQALLPSSNNNNMNNSITTNSSSVGNGGQITTENGALDYTLDTLSKSQQQRG
ncbi:unnamed protein product [Echinostoma caproni]|uniref:Zinc finger protein n=1 Tax=Echinostoma caproni TaxID=27848 RepID=A0A183AW49_9TREM|nr:unnamed protein product [Echinostoma caproni]